MEKTFIKKLIERKVPQIVGSYIVAGISLSILIDRLCVRFDLPDYYVSIAIICLLSI